MDIIEYIYTETEKSIPLESMESIEVPCKVNDFIIDNNNIVKRSKTSIVCKCTNNKEMYVIKFSCGFNENIIDEIYRVSNSEEQRTSHIVPIIEKGYIRGGIWYQIYPLYNRTLSECAERMTMNELNVFLNQINSALHYLHKKLKILHMDIKPENIFINENGYFLGDYDTACHCGEPIKRNFFIGTREYAPIDDLKKESVYSELWDYGTLGNVLRKIMKNNKNLNTPYVCNIVKGLTNSLDSRWSYSELNDICSGKYIDCDQNTVPQKLTKVIVNNNFFFGFDDNDFPIVVNNLQELGKCLRKYSKIALQRHINNQNGWGLLVQFVSRIDGSLGNKVEEILTDSSMEPVIKLDKLSTLLYEDNPYLFYKGKTYFNFQDLLGNVCMDNYESEFIDLIESKNFNKYLEEQGNEEYKEAFRKINRLSFTRKEVKYYLILYYMKMSNSFEKELIGDCQGYSMKQKLEIIKQKLCSNLDLFKCFRDKLEAWLIIQGYENEINKIMEVSLKYE